MGGMRVLNGEWLKTRVLALRRGRVCSGAGFVKASPMTIYLPAPWLVHSGGETMKHKPLRFWLFLGNHIHQIWEKR